MIKISNKSMAWLITISSIIIPGSGHVFLGKPLRGLFMLLWMFVFGYITFQLSTNEISFIGRISGGLAIWSLSVIEVYRLVTS